MAKLLAISQFINAVSEWSGRIIAFLIVVIMGIICWDVIARYFFMSPLLWGADMSNILFGAYFLTGGAFTLRYKSHVNVDILFSRFSPRVMAALELVGFFFLAIFSTILVWQGTIMALRSWKVMETTASAWGGPIYIVKTFIPIGAFLLFIQGISNALNSLMTLLSQKDTTHNIK